MSHPRDPGDSTDSSLGVFQISVESDAEAIVAAMRESDLSWHKTMTEDAANLKVTYPNTLCTS